MFKKEIENHVVISFFHEVATTKGVGGGSPLLKVCSRHRSRGVGRGARTLAMAKKTEGDKVQGQQMGKGTACEKMQMKVNAERVDKA